MASIPMDFEVAKASRPPGASMASLLRDKAANAPSVAD